ncbi:MAG: threonine synthase, partial [Clostridia bacterium]|nr:threonine synthase [Clostridia bacterium]
MIKYYSTRDINKVNGVCSAQAIKQGLAADGGLFIPETIPAVDSAFISKLVGLSYTDRATEVLSLFLEDYTRKELKDCCEAAYSPLSFPGGAAPLKKINDSIYSLELWHGPTCAFKDMALQLMPRLLSLALKKTGEKRTALILVATSGDTGKAALEGYRDVDGIKIQVYYPAYGVSRVQKLQMITQSGANVDVCGINGNFDDAQNGVKAIFADEKVAAELNKKGYFLSSANSINWGRLVPQIVYYFSAYCDLIAAGDIKNGDKINICVPTGNFGNIFAGYIAYRMGLPVGRFICASNRNNVLTDFLDTGVYDRNRPFYQTTSPSMDILISSNLERLLYLAAGPEKTASYMQQQKEKGVYSVEPEVFAHVTEMFTGL